MSEQEMADVAAYYASLPLPPSEARATDGGEARGLVRK